MDIGNTSGSKREQFNVFKKFNRWPSEHGCKHALELVKSVANEPQENEAEAHEKLHSTQISDPPEDLDGDNLGSRVDKLWLEELEQRGPEESSLVRVLFRSLEWDYIEALVWCVVVRMLCVLWIVESLRLLIENIDQFHQFKSDANELISGNGSSELLSANNLDLDETYAQIVWLAANLVLATSSFFILTSSLRLKFARCGLKARVLMTQLIRRKSLRVHLASSIEDSSSRALSLVTNEVVFVEEAHKFIAYVIVGPGCLILASLWLAITLVGWLPVLCTVPALILFISIELYAPSVYKRISRLRKLETNKRLEVMNTVLSSMKVVKMYAWEWKFRQKLESLRAKESEQMRYLDKFTILDLLLLNITNRILPAIVFLASILINNQLDRRILFTTSVAYGMWRVDGLFYFPKALRGLSDLLTACESIKQYLLLDEFADSRRKARQMQFPGLARIWSKNLRVTLEAGSARHLLSGATQSLEEKAQKNGRSGLILKLEPPASGSLPIIDGLDLDLRAGDLVLVVGPVGSGKSSLLLTLLGETRITGGQLTITEGARVAYASQEPCILPDTLRNNIVNGRPFDEQRYNQVLDVCCLRPDIGQLPGGDCVMVGSKGVALSGGQKARVNLARAIYSQADIYLLDDPLSALDSRVAREIFTKCLCELLGDKLVVLATHQLQFASLATKLVLLDRNARPISGLTSDILKNESKIKLMIEKFAEGQSKIDDLTQNSSQISDGQSQPEAHQQVTGNKLESSGKNKISANSSRTEGPRGGQQKLKKGTYWFLLKLGFGIKGLIYLLAVGLVYAASCGYADYYFRLWSNEAMKGELEQQQKRGQNDGYIANLLSLWFVFVAIILVQGISAILFMLLFIKGIRKAAEKLHKQMVNALLAAKMGFYDFCSMGELSSRYAGDFAAVDHALIYSFLVVGLIILMILATLVPMALINALQLVPYGLLLATCAPIAIAKYGNLKTLMKLDKLLRAPLYTSLSCAIEELSTIRSEPDHLSNEQRRFNRHQNRLTSMSLLAMSYEARLTAMLKLASMFTLSVMLYILLGLFRDQIELSATGTFLMMAIMSVGAFPALMEYGSALESSMVSVGSVRRLTEIEPEEEDDRAAAGSRQRRWPVGRIKFSQVTMRYFANERPAINRLSLEIGGGERLGVVGRTGAGKSSIVSVLYRLYPFEGRIEMDGIDTKSLPLSELRSSLGVIPQDPVLFCDSLRRNLDPFEQFSDEQLWRALEVVKLKQHVVSHLPEKLEQLMSEGGRNFSVGQRQLICLARAVLRAPKILLIDEATANVDSETDSFIQATIRSQFKGSTIITIAHRLDTVLDYDRVLVLGAGEILEFDTVENLLNLENGVFKSMLQSSSTTSG